MDKHEQYLSELGIDINSSIGQKVLKKLPLLEQYIREIGIDINSAHGQMELERLVWMEEHEAKLREKLAEFDKDFAEIRRYHENWNKGHIEYEENYSDNFF